MIIFRNNDRTSPTITESSLSFKAMGLLMVIITHPTPGLLTLDALVNAKTDDEDSVLEALSELYQAGYLLYLRWQSPNGNWSEEYLIFESVTLKDNYLKTLPSDHKEYITDPKPPEYIPLKRGSAV